MNIYPLQLIAWATEKLKITKQDVMKPRENFNFKEDNVCSWAKGLFYVYITVWASANPSIYWEGISNCLVQNPWSFTCKYIACF